MSYELVCGVGVFYPDCRQAGAETQRPQVTRGLF
jgi:hypothetical protein